MRKGGGPTLIECKTYRYRGHSEHDPALYRDKKELIEWEAATRFRSTNFSSRRRATTSSASAKKSMSASAQVVQAAVDFAEQSPMPEVRRKRSKISTRRRSLDGSRRSLPTARK